VFFCGQFPAHPVRLALGHAEQAHHISGLRLAHAVDAGHGFLFQDEPVVLGHGL
jgi:hypothetical protein